MGNGNDPIVRFVKLHPSAKLPTRANPDDSGADLYALQEYTLLAGETRVFDLGIGIRLPTGYEAQIRPRSGLTSKGIVSQLGTIDASFTGQLRATLTNTKKYDSYKVRAGDRIAQLVVAPVTLPTIVWADEETQPQTSRGDSGFGSSGR